MSLTLPDTIIGKVGKELTTEEGYEAAKYCGLNLCATLKVRIYKDSKNYLIAFYATQPILTSYITLQQFTHYFFLGEHR